MWLKHSEFSVQEQMSLDARKPIFWVCNQPRPRSACASAQTNQCLYYSLFAQYHV